MWSYIYIYHSARSLKVDGMENIIGCELSKYFIMMNVFHLLFSTSNTQKYLKQMVAKLYFKYSKIPEANGCQTLLQILENTWSKWLPNFTSNTRKYPKQMVAKLWLYFCAFWKSSRIPRKTRLQEIVIWRCMHRAPSCNMYINQQVAQNSCD